MTVVQNNSCSKPGCTVGCECDRYIEIWNNNILHSLKMTEMAIIQH